MGLLSRKERKSSYSKESCSEHPTRVLAALTLYPLLPLEVGVDHNFKRDLTRIARNLSNNIPNPDSSSKHLFIVLSFYRFYRPAVCSGRRLPGAQFTGIDSLSPKFRSSFLDVYPREPRLHGTTTTSNRQIISCNCARPYTLCFVEESGVLIYSASMPILSALSAS